MEIYRHGNKPDQLVDNEGIPVRFLPRFNERSYALAITSGRLTFEASRFGCACVCLVSTSAYTNADVIPTLVGGGR